MERDWWVYSTAIMGQAILVVCRSTGAHGKIVDPTNAEWRTAFFAPSKNYRWGDSSRVILTQEGSTMPEKDTVEEHCREIDREFLKIEEKILNVRDEINKWEQALRLLERTRQRLQLEQAKLRLEG